MGKQEVSHVIYTQLHFKTILCQSSWESHYSCIVNEDVQGISLLFETLIIEMNVLKNKSKFFSLTFQQIDVLSP